MAGDRAEWSARSDQSFLHILVFQFDTPAHAAAMLDQYVAAACSYFTSMQLIPGAPNGISFVESSGETTGRALLVVGPDLISLTTCGCQAQMQSAAEGWARSANAAYATSGRA